MQTYDLERRIVAEWDDATPEDVAAGGTWYQDAHAGAQAVATQQGITLEQAVGVTAALSPGLRWNRNLWWASELAAAWKEGRAESLKIPTYSYANVRKAIRILAGEKPEDVLKGPKVTAFYRLILTAGESDDVCIDGHAYGIAKGDHRELRKIKTSKPEVRRVAEAYRRAARKIGVKPCVLQAVTWVTRKRKREGR